MKPSRAERFWARVEKLDGCWAFKGAHSADGYGSFWDGTRAVRAHRYAWELANGPIPAGLLIRHSCDNPSCVRPDHLSLGTDADNKADSMARGRHHHGERHANARLTNDLVLLIAARVAAGEVQAAVARDLGVSAHAVRSVVSLRTWRHIERPAVVPTPIRGERQHFARLTSKLVRTIREAYATGRVTIAELAREHGVSWGAVEKVVAGQSWKHVPSRHPARLAATRARSAAAETQRVLLARALVEGQIYFEIDLDGRAQDRFVHVMSRPARGEIRGYRIDGKRLHVLQPCYTGDWPDLDRAVERATGFRVVTA